MKLSQEIEILKKENEEEKIILKEEQIKTLIEKTKTTSRRKIEIIAKDIAPCKKNNKIYTPTYLGNGDIECRAIFKSEKYVLFEKVLKVLSEEHKKNLSFDEAISMMAEIVLEYKFKRGNKKAQIIVEKKDERTLTTTTKAFGDIEVSKENFLAGEKKKQRAIPNKIKDEVYKRDGGKCIICAKTDKLHFHHIIPLNDGAKHEVSGITLLCSSCHALHHNSYLNVFINEAGEIKYKFKNKNITRFTDYLYETKKNLAKNKNLEGKKLVDPNDKQKLLF